MCFFGVLQSFSYEAGGGAIVGCELGWCQAPRNCLDANGVSDVARLLRWLVGLEFGCITELGRIAGAQVVQYLFRPPIFQFRQLVEEISAISLTG